jgi:hypothetical protein
VIQTCEDVEERVVEGERNAEGGWVEEMRAEQRGTETRREKERWEECRGGMGGEEMRAEQKGNETWREKERWEEWRRKEIYKNRERIEQRCEVRGQENWYWEERKRKVNRGERRAKVEQSVEMKGDEIRAEQIADSERREWVDQSAGRVQRWEEQR